MFYIHHRKRNQVVDFKADAGGLADGVVVVVGARLNILAPLGKARV